MVPIFSFIGESKVGKTSILEKIIEELKNRGYRVGVIKHTHHQDFEVDIPGKDSWRFQRAGADSVVLSSSSKIFLVKRLDRELTLEEIVNEYLSDADIILTEGYKESEYPKIWIISGKEKHNFEKSKDIIAVICKKKIKTDIIQFEANDIVQIVDFLKEKIS